MRCEEVMKDDVECLGPDDTVETAASRMKEANVGFLPICDENDKVLGTVTDRDLVLRVIAEGKDYSTVVSDVMTRDAVFCSPGDDLREAERLMAERHVSRILCCDEDETLVGVISLSDIAQREDARRTAATLKGVSEREAHP